MVWCWLKKFKTEPPYDSEIPFLDIYPKEMKAVSQREICIPTFIAKLCTISDIYEQCKSMCIHSLKIEENLAICMNLKGIMANEISRTQTNTA